MSTLPIDSDDLALAIGALLEDATVPDLFAEITGEDPAQLPELDDRLDRGVIPFRDAGVMTNNAGLVVRLSDGSEFQITVVRSR